MEELAPTEMLIDIAYRVQSCVMLHSSVSASSLLEFTRRTVVKKSTVLNHNTSYYNMYYNIAAVAAFAIIIIIIIIVSIALHSPMLTRRSLLYRST